MSEGASCRAIPDALILADYRLRDGNTYVVRPMDATRYGVLLLCLLALLKPCQNSKVVGLKYIRPFHLTSSMIPASTSRSSVLTETPAACAACCLVTNLSNLMVTSFGVRPGKGTLRFFPAIWDPLLNTPSSPDGGHPFSFSDPFPGYAVVRKI